jgi:uncharacterized membrane protein YkvI
MPVKESRGAVNIAAAYIGAVIGAGFLSGQEIMEFFLSFGVKGIIGTLLSGILFGALGSSILQVSFRRHVKSYEGFVTDVMGPYIGRFMDIVLFGLSLGTLGIMLAGAGQLVSEQFNVTALVGIGLTSLSLLVAINWGIDSILLVNKFLVPILMCTGPGIAIATISSCLGGSGSSVLVAPQAQGSWLLSSILYVSYNSMIALTFLAPLGGECQSEGAAKGGGWLGGLILGVASNLIAIALYLKGNMVLESQLPMLILARGHGPVVQGIYVFSLWAAIFTTALSNLYGLSVRLGESVGCNWKKVTIPLMLVGIALSYAGFSKLIGLVYPFFGLLGLPFIFLTIAKSPSLKERFAFFFQRRG